MRAQWKQAMKSVLKAAIFPLLCVALVPELVLLVERWEDLTSDHPYGGLRHRISEYVTDQSIPSVTIAAARDGSIVWEESFGWADREKGQLLQGEGVDARVVLLHLASTRTVR
ncbi:hypothetical protein ACFL6X_08670 [Candidatus Latescibacterota bacterium]